MTGRTAYAALCMDVANRIGKAGNMSMPSHAASMRHLARLCERMVLAHDLPPDEREIEEGTVIGLLRAGFSTAASR